MTDTNTRLNNAISQANQSPAERLLSQKLKMAKDFNLVLKKRVL